MISILAEASGVSLAIGGFLAAVATVVLGSVSNAILRDAGFGTAGNGILMALGAGGGIWSGLAYFGKM